MRNDKKGNKRSNTQKTDHFEELTNNDLTALWLNNKPLIERRCRSFSFVMPFDDLTQEAFFAFRAAVIRFYETNGRFAFSTVLTRSLRWRFIRLAEVNEYSRREETTLNQPTAADDDTENIDLLADKTDYEEIAADNINAPLVLGEYHRTTAKMFTAEEKEVCDLLFLGGLSVREIGKAKNLTEADARRLCGRIRRRIRGDIAFRRRLYRLCDSLTDLETAAYRNTGLKAFRNNQAASQEMYLLQKERRQSVGVFHR